MDEYSNPDRIYNYKYESVNRSVITPVLRPWWRLVLKVIPRATSANLISMMGNLGSLLALLLLMALGASHGREWPWIFGLAALGIGFYHTLDCVDGMQARRIGSSGPLGEFIDHWFDSFNCFFIPLGMIAAFPVIPTPLAMAFVSLAVIADWITLREVEKTNVLYFGPMSTDEGVFMYFLFNLSVCIFGYDFWATPAPFLGFPPVWIMAGFGVSGFICTIMGVLLKNRFLGFGGICVEILLVLPILVWIDTFSPYFLDRSALIGGLFVIGLIGSRFIGDLLRSRLTGFKRPLFYGDTLICDIAILAIIALLHFFPDLPKGLAVLPMAFLAISTAFALFHQYDSTLKRVQDCLGVGLFDIPSPKPQGKEVSAASMVSAEAESR